MASVLTLISSLLVTLALEVPFLPQSEALCGGAAVAMVLRYWGDAHADPLQFAKLVDRRAGGIADRALVDEVKRRGWQVLQLSGSTEMLGEELHHGRPVVVLLQERPGHFHFVVVVGIDHNVLVLHDPARGPSRRMSFEALKSAWAPTGFWSLRILPAEAKPTLPASRSLEKAAATSFASECDRLLADAVGEVQRQGLERAEPVLADVRKQCPAAPGPLRELAGVRFVQRRWAESSALAQEALSLGDDDPYAWEVLASSRYMRDDLDGALAAWNRIGAPRVNLVRIQGVHRTRYPLIADVLGLPINSLLTDEAFRRAARRVGELPDHSTARVSYRPERDGYATVDVAIAERPTVPRHSSEWAAAGFRSAVDREISMVIPGTTGQGELWSASWRWWTERPKVTLAMSAPRTGWLPGVWRVEGGWEQQTYGLGVDSSSSPVRETRAYGRLTMSDWATASLRYTLEAGLDSWNGTRRTAMLGAGFDRRFKSDRVSLAGHAAAWLPLTAGGGFETFSLRLAMRSSTHASGWVNLGDVGVDVASASAPFALWPGAGEGQARERLLRAHPLLDGGVVRGSMIGPTLAYAHAETRRWFDQKWPIRLAGAGFADLAHLTSAGHAAGRPVGADVGGGLRVRFPGSSGTFRVDLGYGLRDRARALTFGWDLY